LTPPAFSIAKTSKLSSRLDEVPPIFSGGGAALGRRHEIARGLVGRLGVDPEHEGILRHHRDRGVVGPVQRQLGRHRRHEDAARGGDQLVRIAGRFLDVEHALGAAGGRLVDDDDRLGGELFFWMMPWIVRAIWSEAPPAAKGTTISIALVGSQAAAGVDAGYGEATRIRQANAASWSSTSLGRALTASWGKPRTKAFCIQSENCSDAD
jgi:hypothetical protein